MSSQQERLTPVRCALGHCNGLGVVYKRIVTPSFTVRLRVCRRHGPLFR